MLAATLRSLCGRLAINPVSQALRTTSISSSRFTSSTSATNAAAALAPAQLKQQQVTATTADAKSVFAQVNAARADQTEGRLFAVVHLCGKQFKVTAGDIILVEGYWPPTIGDRLQLDKVLVAGGADFTLVGRPLLQRGLVRVEATVVEKTLTHTKTHFRKKRRKQYMRINFQRSPNTMLMINAVELVGEVNGDGAERAAAAEEGRIF